MKRLLLVLALALPATACGGPSPAAPVSSADARSTRGTITEVRDEGRVLVIAHEEIPGYMRGMTMPFEVDAAARDATLKKGDAIEFSFVETADGRRLIVKLARK